MIDVMDRIIQIQSALIKAHSLTIEIQKYFHKETTNNHINVLKNNIKRAKKKLTLVKKSATKEELDRKIK
ncbi:hypothetical protein LCGC14_0755470 [marine sediment metagenome]|uniref:Uncharacterized protein n=1 Tax=marine sediment metagenome TaxID=412755 RepID=A0A0F9Q6W1_9ZZZZ